MRNVLLFLAILISTFSPFAVPAQTQTVALGPDFIIGPQVPISNSWFDQTEISRAKFYGAQCPDSPPPPPVRTDYATQADYDAAKAAWANGPLNDFNLLFYYDLPLTEYIAWKRTGDPTFLTYARKCADVWYQHPQWIQSGAQLDFDNGQGPPPRHAGIGGLILRALDGRSDMWPWIVAYTRNQFDVWLGKRVNDPQLYYGVREGAFMLHAAVWVAAVHPDPAVRAEFLSKAESIAVSYYARLQYADGSWRWDDPDYTDHVSTALSAPAAAGAISLPVNPLPYPVQANMTVTLPGGKTQTTAAAPAGAVSLPVAPLATAAALGDVSIEDGQLRGVMQPFMIGLLLNAEIEVHRLSTNETVRTSIANQIVKACRHLYVDGPFRTSLIPGSTARWRDFFYFYHGGTTVNPTKYEQGGGSYTTLNIPEGAAYAVGNGRQAISTIFDAFAYAYLLTGDPALKAAGDDLVDAGFVGTDGFRGLADSTAKNYSQTYRMGGRYEGWRAGSPVSLPSPAPTPSSSPSPSPSPTPAAGDTQPPVVSIVSPVNSATVSRTISVTASASDNVMVDSAYLIVDDAVVGSDGSAPYSFNLDTTKLTDGAHSLYVRAWDTSGNAGDSTRVTFTVANASPTPSPTPVGTPVPSPTPSPIATPTPLPSPSPLPQCRKFNPKGKCVQWSF